MNLTPWLRRVVSVLILLAGSTIPLFAQSTLFADLDGKYFAVRQAHGHAPLVEVDGKLVVADGRQYTLRKAEEYLPAFVDVRDVQVKTRHLNMNASTVNREFIFQATLETPYDLDDVYLVLEMNSEATEKMLFLQEVGTLESHHAKTISATVHLTFDIGRGRYVLHLFAGGREVLQSKIPLSEREAALDRMAAKRIAGVQDAPPKPFTGPDPEYPRALLKAKTTGQAVVSVRIGVNGEVRDPAVKSATDPAFGQSALDAVRLWRFLPKVEAGHPVETQVDVPFNFAPPAKKA